MRSHSFYLLSLFFGITLSAAGFFCYQTLRKSTVSPATVTPASHDIKEIILKDLSADNAVCATRCTVDVVSGNFAKGKMPQGYWIAAKQGGSWKVAVGGNGIPQCKEIDAFSIPKDIFGNCIEASGELRY